METKISDWSIKEVAEGLKDFLERLGRFDNIIIKENKTKQEGKFLFGKNRFRVSYSIIKEAQQ